MKLPIRKINSVNKKIESISKKLDELCKLFPDYKKYLDNQCGTFNYCTIAGTNQISCHSFGITIDINVNINITKDEVLSNYWIWYYKDEKVIDRRVTL